MHDLPDKENQSIATVLVKHQITKDKHHLFEEWLKKIFQAAQCYSGYLGTETMRSLETSNYNYACIFRFDTFKNLERWVASDERRRLLRELRL
jgi:antibiotic biosynthesis monooxygenase (ABM) superfamily enzyme